MQECAPVPASRPAGAFPAHRLLGAGGPGRGRRGFFFSTAGAASVLAFLRRLLRGDPRATWDVSGRSDGCWQVPRRQWNRWWEPGLQRPGPPWDGERPIPPRLAFAVIPRCSCRPVPASCKAATPCLERLTIDRSGHPLGGVLCTQVTCEPPECAFCRGRGGKISADLYEVLQAHVRTPGVTVSGSRALPAPAPRGHGLLNREAGPPPTGNLPGPWSWAGRHQWGL